MNRAVTTTTDCAGNSVQMLPFDTEPSTSTTITISSLESAVPPKASPCNPWPFMAQYTGQFATRTIRYTGYFAHNMFIMIYIFSLYLLSLL